jgi:hypothetical protein
MIRKHTLIPCMLLHFHNAVNEGDHAPQVANELVPPAVVNIEHNEVDPYSPSSQFTLVRST